MKRPRHVTYYVAALVRKGERDPQHLFDQAWAAITAGEVICPRTATIFWHCFRNGVSMVLFPDAAHPWGGHYHKVLETLGPQWCITPAQFAERTGLPLRSVRPA